MRVLRSGGRDDRGAIAIIVGFCLVMMFGFGAIAVDLGQAWSERRQLVIGTDASALAAAQEFATGGNGCTSAAGNLLADNVPTAALDACTPRGTDLRGSVTVNASTEIDFFFARVLGIDSGDIASSTTTEWGYPKGLKGLRPFGLCASLPDTTPAQGWLAQLLAFVADPDPDPNGTVITVPYGKDDNPDACNEGDSVPGNWGVLDFNGGSNPQGETNDWTEYGYDDIVYAGTRGEDCNSEPEYCVEGNPGAFNNPLSGPLEMLRTSGQPFALPLFGAVDDDGGANAEFHIFAFVKVVLEDYRVTGQQDGRYLRIRLLPGILEGECCDDNPDIDTGVRVIAICAVDPDDLRDCPT